MTELAEKVIEETEAFIGHEIKPHHLKAFQYYTDGMGVNEIAALIGVTTNTVYQWKQKLWWRQLHSRLVEEHQQDFMARLMSRSDQVLQNYLSVLNGDNPNDRTANARIAAVKLFMEAGENPLIKKNHTTNQFNTQINQVSLDPEKLHDLSIL